MAQLQNLKYGLTNNNISISAFFPCYDDSGTIASQVKLTIDTLAKISHDYEVIVVDDGSTDNSRDILSKLKDNYPDKLRLVFHNFNMGYGAALRSGFKAATKNWVFYTDGDAQYDVRELTKLVNLAGENVDIVQGFKIKRRDPWHRILIGKIYQHLMRFMFRLKIKDVDCDFRLMRRDMLERIDLEHNSGAICLEMIKKMQNANFKFVEVGVSHYFRMHGKSQFFNFRRIFRVAVNVIKLWWQLVIIKKGRACG